MVYDPVEQKIYREANREKRLAYLREWQKKNPEKVKKANRSYYEKHREEILAEHKTEEYRAKRRAYRNSSERQEKERKESRNAHRLRSAEYAEFLAGFSCSRCGVADYRVLCFHHRDPAQKDFNCSKKKAGSWDALLKEIEKCDCLCRNCHAIVHYELKEDDIYGFGAEKS
jgi:hypothetical protein